MDELELKLAETTAMLACLLMRQHGGPITITKEELAKYDEVCESLWLHKNLENGDWVIMLKTKNPN